MKVAWVCYYPGSLFPDRLKINSDPMFHPIPWITAQAPVLAHISGIELHIVTVKKNCLADDHFEQDGIHFHFLKVPSLPRVLLFYQVDLYRIRRCLQNIVPDVVHGFGTESSYGFSAVYSGYPSLLRIQGIMAEITAAMGKKHLYRNPALWFSLWLEQQTIRRCRNFVCETEFAANYVLQRNPQAKIYRTEKLVRDAFHDIQRNPVPAAEPELLFVGSVIPEKGIEVLLKSFVRVLVAFPTARLHIAGAYENGYFLNVLKPLVADLDLQDRVLFHGYCSLDELLPLFARVSSVVLPTLMDTAPNVMAEAMAAGAPVVASAVGGIPEMLAQGALGVLVQPGSEDSLAEGIIQVLSNPDQAIVRAAFAQEKARREFNIEAQARKLVDIYQQLIA